MKKGYLTEQGETNEAKEKTEPVLPAPGKGESIGRINIQPIWEMAEIPC